MFAGLAGIATDILADRLRSLEAAGAVQQTQLRYPTPAKVYELTERGRNLAAIAGSLARRGAPLLPASPNEPMRINPRWALQSMISDHTGNAGDGRHAITIDDDDTIAVTGPVARISYGPPTDERSCGPAAPPTRSSDSPPRARPTASRSTSDHVEPHRLRSRRAARHRFRSQQSITRRESSPASVRTQRARSGHVMTACERWRARAQTGVPARSP